MILDFGFCIWDFGFWNLDFGILNCKRMPKICPVEFQASQKGWLYLCLLKVNRD